MKPVKICEYGAGTRRMLPECTGCSRVFHEFDGKPGLYCKIHISNVEKADHFLHVFRVYRIDKDNPYKQKREECELLQITEPRYVDYENSYAGMVYANQSRSNNQPSNEEESDSMLKEQRERLPAFLENIRKIIERDGMNKVTELLEVTGPTVKQWMKGKDNGGTEPPSSDYKRYEQLILDYVKEWKETVSEPAKQAPVVQVSARDTYLGSIARLKQFSGYILGLYPDVPAMKKIFESAERLLSKPEEYETWNLQMAMKQTAQEYKKALFTTVPEMKGWKEEIDAIERAINGKKGKAVQKDRELIQALQEKIQTKKETLEAAARGETQLKEEQTVDNQSVKQVEPAERLEQVVIANILPNPYQPRKIFREEEIRELAASMKKDGLIQPIVVRQTAEGLMLVAGERRMRAALTLNWSTIKAVVTTMDEAQAAAASIIENYQRVQNNPIEIADAVANMIERTGVTQADVAKMIGVSQPKIAQMISLTKLIDSIKDLIIEEKVSPSVGRVIAALDPVIQARLKGSLENLSSEKAQHFVNVYKGLNDLGNKPEVESDGLDVKLLKRLFQGGFIDLFDSTWASLEHGLKTIQADKVTGVYVPYTLFADPTGMYPLLQKCGLGQYSNPTKKPAFKLVATTRTEATEVAKGWLEALMPKEPEAEPEPQLTEEEKQQQIMEKLQTLKTKVEEKYEQTKGTAYEHSYALLFGEFLDLDQEEVFVIEHELEVLRETFSELNDAFSDPERQKHLNRLQEALRLANDTKEEFAGTDWAGLLQGHIRKIEHELSNHMSHENYELSRKVTALWMETSHTVEAAQLSRRKNIQDEEPTVETIALGAGEQPIKENHEASKTAPVNQPVPMEVIRNGVTVQNPLNPKPERSKTNRVLQILQEESHRLHETSVRCRECQFFNAHGSTYRERCMDASISFHSFRRFTVEGSEAFNCHSYTPKLEVMERKKEAANLDLTIALLELLIYDNGYSKEYPSLTWAVKEIPELRGTSCKPDEVMALFKKQDEKTRAYWVEVFYRHYQLSNVVSRDKPHPVYMADGKRFMMDYNSMENDDQI